MKNNKIKLRKSKLEKQLKDLPNIKSLKQAKALKINNSYLCHNGSEYYLSECSNEFIYCFGLSSMSITNWRKQKPENANDNFVCIPLDQALSENIKMCELLLKGSEL